LKKRLNKGPTSAQMSVWNQVALTADQVKYAAVDAAVSLRLDEAIAKQTARQTHRGGLGAPIAKLTE
jgi:ribonuclease D